MIKRLCLGLIVAGILCASIGYAQQDFIGKSLGTEWDSLERPEEKNPHWEFVVPPKYKFADIQTTGTADTIYFLVKEKDLWGMHDQAGKKLIAADKYVREPIFFEDNLGLAVFEKDGQKTAIYIDKNGKQAIPGEFYVAWPFDGPVAMVWLKNKKFALIDRQGKIVSAEYSSANKITEGLAGFSADGKLWGYLDAFGKVAIEPKFKKVEFFYEGLAAVHLEDGSCGYIRKDGAYQIAPKYQYCGRFYSGMAQVSEEPKSAKMRKFYCIDKDGQQLLNGTINYDDRNMTYDSSRAFVDDLLIVRALMPTETCPDVFRDEYLLVGAVNKNGKAVVPFDFFEINDFDDQGYASAKYKEFKLKASGQCVGTGGLEVKVSKTGQVYGPYAVVPALVEESAPFWQKLVVSKGKKMNSDGWARYGLSYFYNEHPEKVFIQPQFHRVIHLSGPYFKVEVDDNVSGPWGVIKVKE